eukprot:TRINITY_DN677_c0_g1_i2.p1 TRINITY_DN677_c0_g1~~TRINITY_DN677_c0_g1_i2.p1  ORF type:complete len:589 (+),score=124.22 TRINITY_DN677_c0_g1_i2:49-1815(+)
MKSILVLVLCALIISTEAATGKFNWPVPSSTSSKTTTSATSASSPTSATSAAAAATGATSSTPSATSATSGSSSIVTQLVSNANTNAQQLSLPYINKIRASVSPQPDVALQPLAWDDNLANSAKQWASKCYTYDYSDDYYNGKVGETFFATPLDTSTVGFLTGITSWGSQNTTFNLADNSCYPGVDCSQFKQIAWSNTKSVGCGLSACGTTLLLVCQYSPPSFEDLSPYISSVAANTLTRFNISSGEASLVPVGSGSRKRGTSCTANGQTGQCVAQKSCTSANGATAAYYGSGVCSGYLSSSTVCCIYKNSPTSTPTSTPTASPTKAATPSPTKSSTPSPTKSSTPSPTKSSTPSPTKSATTAPTPAPSGTRLTFPASQDWRDATGAVTPVKNQKSCGSCWAFATTAVVESAYSIFTGGSVADMAEQQVLSCTNPGNYNCANGGWPTAAFSYVVKNGIVSENKDAYTATDGTCSTYTPDFSFTGAKTGTVSPLTKDGLLAALKTYGPLAVTVNADSAWQGYKKGILSNSSYTSTNHAVTLVGYDSANDAYIIKNSWGSSWGESGFIRISTQGDFGMTKSTAWYFQKNQ